MKWSFKMKYILILAALISLTSCFKTDTDGNVFLFENDNSAQLTFKMDGLNASAYFGINGQYGPSTADVTAFSNDNYWCLRRINYNLQSGTDGATASWDILINGTIAGAGAYTAGQELNLTIHPGDNLIMYYSCPSCSLATGSFSLELDKCDN